MEFIDTEDALLAHRYLYYVLGTPVLSDREYDELEKEFLAGCPWESPIAYPGSSLESSYEERVIRLANEILKSK